MITPIRDLVNEKYAAEIRWLANQFRPADVDCPICEGLGAQNIYIPQIDHWVRFKCPCQDGELLSEIAVREWRPGWAMRASQMPYREYLRSAHWQRIKRAVYVWQGKKCVRCGCEQFLQVHHKTYTTLGVEDIDDDLELLDDRCHARIHGKTPKHRNGPTGYTSVAWLKHLAMFDNLAEEEQ